MLRRAGIKYVTRYHRGGALCISSLTRCGHAWLSEDPVGGRISITVWLIGVIYSPLPAADSFGFLDAFYCPSTSLAFPRRARLWRLGDNLLLNCLYSNRRIIAGLCGGGVGRKGWFRFRRRRKTVALFIHSVASSTSSSSSSAAAGLRTVS